MNAIEMWHKAQAIRLIVKASIINKERYSRDIPTLGKLN